MSITLVIMVRCDVDGDINNTVDNYNVDNNKCMI